MVPAAIDEREWQTRRERIDPRLIAAGWEPRPCRDADLFGSSGRLALTEYPTDAGPADYALTVDGTVLGIVEAKRVGVAPAGVLHPGRAVRTRPGAEARSTSTGSSVPFLYSTNGELIWFHDVRHPLNRSRKVAGFHTPDALRELLDRDLEAACQRPAGHSPTTTQRLRPYQIEANTAIEQAIADRKRHMLVAMATGTGKTFTMVNEIYRLMKSGVARRILFLVDRRALAAQAVRAFASFEPEPGLKFNQIYEVYSQRFQREDIEDEPFDPNVLPTSYLAAAARRPRLRLRLARSSAWRSTSSGATPSSGSGDEEIDEDADRLDIPIHAFDLIDRRRVPPRLHRAGTLGLAQHPRPLRRDQDRPHRHAGGAHHDATSRTSSIRYDYERAVREGFLVDYDVVAVRSDVRMNGVFLDEGEQVGVVDPTPAPSSSTSWKTSASFEAPEVERRVTSPDSNRKIVEEIKKYAIEHERETRPFPQDAHLRGQRPARTSPTPISSSTPAATSSARATRSSPRSPGRVDRPLQRIREFRNRPSPAIVVSVDLMSTGVDIPDLEFIVFLRPVRSRILFEQMLGRGTRKGDRFPDKSHFMVFDCFDGTLARVLPQGNGASPPSRPSAPLGPLSRSSRTSGRTATASTTSAAW